MSIKSRTYLSREKRKCKSKKTYPDSETASKNTSNYFPYLCPHCNKYHLTKNEKNTITIQNIIIGGLPEGQV